MHISPLYEQAVELSPRAARIAAALLVQEPALPAPLRRSLVIALGAGGADDDPAVRCSRLDRDARAARRFVDACKQVCAHR